MAGESPDKTEQRKSSGTAAEERDPRFAVFREPGAEADADATADVTATAGAGADADEAVDGAVDGATTDTATAVFRPRLPEDEAVRAPEASAEPADSGRAAEPVDPVEPGEPVESAEEEPAEAAEGVVTPQKPVGGSEGSEGPDAAAEPSEGDVEGTAAAVDAAGSEPEPGDVRLRAAVAAWVDAAAEGDDKGEEQPESKAAADADAHAGVDADEDADVEPGAEAEAEAAPKPVEESEPAEEPEAGTERAAAADGAEAAADSETDSDSDSDPDDDTSGPDAGTGSDLRGTDQPTAVFKAVVPAGRVDQPTTALKLSPQELQELKAAGDKARGTSGSASPTKQAEPEQKKPEQKKPEQKKPEQKKPEQEKPEQESPEQGKPESAVERTSTFVPLRSDDARPAPAPRAPETPEAPETGTPVPAGTPAAAPETASATPSAPSWAAAERTRQQPLPPKPPLDLLAELTNTPPPAETPVRTAVRRVKIWTPLVLLLLIVFAIVQVMRPLPEPVLELTAKPTYTFEGGGTKLSWPGQGQSAVMVDGVGSLGSEGAQKPAPIASVAKVMTAYVILQEHPLKGDEEGETITADQKAEDESKNADESTAPLTKGQQLTQRQMLQLLMIPSGNNAARLLARWDAGSEDKFIDKMNDAAKDLGMTGSTYTDPSGLKKTTVSTATDQLKLAQAVMRNDVFRKIVDMPEIEIKGIDGKIYNNNTLLLEPGVSGIKTGSSTPAGGNLLWSANTVVDGKTLWIYGAVMGQQAGTGRVYDSLTLSLTNSLKLIKGAQEAPTSTTVVKKGDVVGYVDNGFGAQTPVIATKNLKAVGWAGLEVELKVTDSGKGIAHAAKSGSEVGMVTVGTGTGKVTAPVVLQDDLTEPAFGDKLTRIG
ncbi:D-alanyl-D-alanine carboxypeptidase family protein [Streptomyces microflavus]|uniref:D-alanyl-D-alanine carboxypeptidase family protein n=1 Tax=Streptomyces microflavus TaxID=1919 RepID=UPI003451E822